MASARATVVKTNGDVEFITLPETNAYLTIQDYVGGVFDVVNVPDEGIVVYVNDEGLLIGLEPNAVASLITNRLLVGDAVIVGTLDASGNEDGENYDVPTKFHNANFAVVAKEYGTDEKLVSELIAVRDNTDWTPTVTTGEW